MTAALLLVISELPFDDPGSSLRVDAVFGESFHDLGLGLLPVEMNGFLKHPGVHVIACPAYGDSHQIRLD